MVGDGGGGVTVVVVYTRGARSRTRGEGGVVKVVIALTLRGRWEATHQGRKHYCAMLPGALFGLLCFFFVSGVGKLRGEGECKWWRWWLLTCVDSIVAVTVFCAACSLPYVDGHSIDPGVLIERNNNNKE